MLRVLLKIVLAPLVGFFGFASVLTRISFEIGTRVGAIIINIFAVIGIINLIGKDIPCAAISGVIILLVLAILFFAVNLELFFDSIKDSLKKI